MLSLLSWRSHVAMLGLSSPLPSSLSQFTNCLAGGLIQSCPLVFSGGPPGPVGDTHGQEEVFLICHLHLVMTMPLSP